MNPPAPGRVEAAARARAARRRTKHERWAEEMRHDEWIVIPPETQPEQIRALINELKQRLNTIGDKPGETK